MPMSPPLPPSFWSLFGLNLSAPLLTERQKPFHFLYSSPESIKSTCFILPTECASSLLSTTARSTTSALTSQQFFFSEIAAKSDIPDCVDLDGEGNGQGSTPLWGPVWRHRAPGSWRGDQFLVLGPHGAPKIWQTQIWQFSSKFEIRSHILTLGVKFDSGSNFWGIQVTYMQPHGFSLVTMVFKCIMME